MTTSEAELCVLPDPAVVSSISANHAMSPEAPPPVIAVGRVVAHPARSRTTAKQQLRTLGIVMAAFLQERQVNNQRPTTVCLYPPRWCEWGATQIGDQSACAVTALIEMRQCLMSPRGVIADRTQLRHQRAMKIHRLLFSASLGFALTACTPPTSIRTIRMLGEPTIGSDGTAWVVGVDNTAVQDGQNTISAESVFVIFCHQDRVPQCVRVAPELRQMSDAWRHVANVPASVPPRMSAPAASETPTNEGE